ncbi:Predicted esterase [Nitratireductor aquibiodomus]|uniref:Predicted esterase n=1 Tax=Nitratireductor aquibiodomus TaxID=204799 RepID=A0A1H4MPE5_9HYPH|nr:alpha/beta hydrolase [Nitratireductor aquibiodomus]SEB84931.1 Predicted esterase [Nitratireductor aquibiodomus]
MRLGGDAIALEKGVADHEADSRFAYAWTLAPSRRPDRPLLIAVHGSARDHLQTRDAFDDLAARQDINVFAPLFPSDVTRPGYSDGYKFLREPGIDYAMLLESMAAAFRARFALGSQPAYLFGFSGGAQFALRYALVAAGKLSGAVIAAPGAVTLLDTELPWWPGVDGIERAIGRSVDRKGLEGLPLHLLIGANDSDQGLVTRGPDHPEYSPYADIAGANRHQRMEALKESLEKSGLKPGFEYLDGVGHELGPVAVAAAGAIEKWL